MIETSKRTVIKAAGHGRTPQRNQGKLAYRGKPDYPSFVGEVESLKEKSKKRQKLLEYCREEGG